MAWVPNEQYLLALQAARAESLEVYTLLDRKPVKKGFNNNN